MSGGGRTTRASHRIVANPRPSRSRDNREIACPSENEIYVAALLKSRLQKRISHRQRLWRTPDNNWTVQWFAWRTRRVDAAARPRPPCGGGL